METYNITKIEVVQSDTAGVPDMTRVFIVDADNGLADVFTCAIGDLTESLIELSTKYHIKGNIAQLLEPHNFDALPSLKSLFPTVTFYRDPVVDGDKWVASTKNGDTGHEEHAYGSSIGQALGNLARDHGFVSTIDVDSQPKLGAWIEEFNYGFQRMSDEQLAAEMEAILSPEKGGW